jgi:hypothetical protein
VNVLALSGSPSRGADNIIVPISHHTNVQLRSNDNACIALQLILEVTLILMGGTVI